MPYADFKTVPILSGDLSIAASIVWSARNRFCRVAVLGDSQETSPGGNGQIFAESLQAISTRLFGPPKETRLNYSASYGGGSPPNVWCVRGTNYGNSTASDLPANRYLPNIGATKTAGDLDGGLLVGLQHRGQNNGVWTADRDEWFPLSLQNGMQADVFAFPAPASPTGLQVSYSPLAIGAPNYYAPGPWTTHLSGNIGLTGSGSELVRYRAPAYSPSLSLPMTQVLVRGANGGTVAANAHIVGIRFVLPHDYGLTFDFFAAGGYSINSSINSILQSRASSGPMLAGLGPWAAVVLCFGANDFLISTAAQYEAHVRSLIAWIRAALGAGQSIILLGDGGRSGLTAPQLAEYDQQAGVHQLIAGDTAGVLAINQRRQFHQTGFVLPDATWMSDGVHWNNIPSSLRASFFMEAIAEASALTRVVVDANLTHVNGSPVLLGDLKFSALASNPAEGGLLKLVPGNGYSETGGNAIAFQLATWTDLANVQSVALSLVWHPDRPDRQLLINRLAGQIQVDAKRVYFEPDETVTTPLNAFRSLNSEDFCYSVDFTMKPGAGGKVQTRVHGHGIVLDPVAPLP